MITPLRLARERRKMTQREVASAVGIERSHYTRIESADHGVSAAVAKRLAEFFGAPLTRDQILFPEDYLDRRARGKLKSFEALPVPRGREA